MSVVVIADDLTGACDTAVKLISDFERVRVLFDLPAEEPPDTTPACYAVSTESRTLEPKRAYVRVLEQMKQLHTLHYEFVYKKVDSMLRGNCGAEIEAIMQALSIDFVVLALAAPLTDRKVINGVLTVEANFAQNIPILKAISATVQGQFASVTLDVIRQGASAIAHRLARERENGSKIVLMDAETQGDLEQIARACAELPFAYLPVGTNGFIGPLVKCWQPERKRIRSKQYRPDGEKPVLVLLGTFHPITARQVELLSKERHTHTIWMNVARCLEGDAEQELERIRASALTASPGRRVIQIAVSSMRHQPVQVTDGRSVGRDISHRSITNCLSEAAARVLDAVDVSGIVVSGGDTARSVLQRLGARRLDLFREPLPGIAMGVMSNDRDRRWTVATKSGGFGEPDALLRLTEYLRTGILPPPMEEIEEGTV